MAEPPYAGLTPDRVLDALDSVGIRGDGRLLALNSYENRVYQVWRDDAAPVVAKFYRPARWSDAQIAEEHEFLAELDEAEVPVVPPLATLVAGTSNTRSGVRPGRRTISTCNPRTGCARAHASASLITFSMWPFACHAGSKCGDFAGMRT